MFSQTHVVSDFKSFIVENNIIATMSAVTVAFSTGTMIRSFVVDILLPAIYGLFVSKVKVKTLDGAFAPLSKLNLDNFIKEFVTFIFVVITIFLFIYYFFKAWVKPPPKTPTNNASATASTVTTEYYRSH